MYILGRSLEDDALFEITSIKKYLIRTKFDSDLCFNKKYQEKVHKREKKQKNKEKRRKKREREKRMRERNWRPRSAASR